MLLTVQSIKSAPKSLVLNCGGKEYFAKKDSGIGVGMTIEAETEDSEYNGKTYCWVKKWKQTNAAPQSSVSASADPATSSRGPSAAVAAPIWANFVSNQVAHAIAAGRIDDPEQIKVWAAAAKQAFMELAG